VSAQVVEIPALPKQIEFLTATDRECLYSGAFGAGKTRAVCLRAVMRASVKGAREGLCRKNLVTLKRTTLKTLLEPEGELDPVLPAGYYEHHKSEQVIRIKGGGEITYFGLDDPDKVASFNLSGCGIDEAVELEEADWTMLRGRIRLDVPRLHNQIYAACNPGAPSHFLAVRFGLAGGAQAQPGCKAVITKTIDNPYLPAAYVEDISRLTGVARKRFFEGLWAGSDRLVYDTWTRPVHVKTREGPWRRTVVGVDVGYTNPGAMVMLHVDGDGRIHQARESYASRILPREWLMRAREWHIQFGPEAFLVDPSSPDVIADWRNAGLPAQAANNERAEGVRIVRACLATAGDGKPRLTVDPTCSNTIREFETWECKPESDEFTKENDHAMDALRYAAMYLASGAGVCREPRYSISQALAARGR